MKGQLISLQYEGKSKDILLSVRCEDGSRKVLHVINFEPYFYCDADAQIPQSRYITKTEYGFKSLFGKDVVKITATDPLAVEKLRHSFQNFYEADIKFVRRFLIDTNIYNGLEWNGRETVYWRDLKPCDISLPLTCVTLDIEVDNTGAESVEKMIENPIYPVIAITLHDTTTNKYVTIILDNKDSREWWAPDWLVIRVSQEIRLFELVKSYLERVQPDVLRNWNLYFDLDVLRGRSKRLGVDLSCIDLSAQFDMLEGYRKIFKKASNYLKDVVIDEGITDEVVSAEFNIHLYRDEKQRDSFIKYSCDDVRFCVAIDTKHRLTGTYWQQKIFTGLEDFAPTFSNSVLVDVMAMRDAHEHNEILPSSNYLPHNDEDDDESSFKGATVLEPPIGIGHDVAIYDMSKFYPSIVLAYGLSPEREDGKGILCRVVRKLMNLRLQADRENQEVLEKFGPNSKEYFDSLDKRMSIKNVFNSTWGYIGYKKSRLYKKDVAERIARYAREGLGFIQQVVVEYAKRGLTKVE